MFKLIRQHYKGIPKLNNVITKQQVPSRQFKHVNFKKPDGMMSYGEKKWIIAKSAMFTVGFTGSAISLATIAQFEKFQFFKCSSWGFDKVNIDIINDMVEWFDTIPDSKKVVFDIVWMNGLVFLVGLYLTRRNGNPASLTKFQNRFYLSPESHKLTQMIYCTFNHHGIIHLAANMFCLYSISGMFDNLMAPEQFFAFYLSAGVFSSFCSKTFNLLASRSIVSLGASGSVVSCFALASFFYPDNQFYIFPLPFPVEARDMLKGIVGMDLIGLLLGFRVIDHMAHLGGAFYAYALFGNKLGKDYFKSYQKYTIRKWMRFKKNFLQ